MSSVPKIEGKLTAKTLGDLLKKIEGHRGAAYLLVSDGLCEKCLYFSVGAIRLTSMGKRRGIRLEDALAAHPRIDAGIMERARQRHAEAGEPLEEILGSAFNLNDVVKEVSTALVRDEVLDLLLWEGAAFEFAESNPPPKIFDPRLEAVKLSLGVNKLLKEAMDAIAKTSHLLARGAAGRARITRGPNWKAGAPGDADKPVCVSIAFAVPQAGAAFEDIVIHARRQGFDALRITDAFEKMLDAKTIEAPKKGAPVQFSKDEEIEVAKRDVDEIEGALDLMINELVARQRLAKGYLAMGDQPRAVFNLRRVGDELLQRNKGDEAIDAFRQIVKIVPHDFGVREKIAYLYERMKKIPEAIGEGMELVNIYKKFGLLNRAKNIFRRIINLEPENVDHRRGLIDVLVKLKENKDAVAEYENLAEIHARREQENELLAVYQNILALDPAHQAARQRTQAIVRRRPGFWVPYVAVACGFIILMTAVAYVMNEYGALKAYKAARESAFAAVDRDDFAAAQRDVDDFLKVHGGSRVAGKASDLKKQLAEIEADRRERAAREEYGRARQLDAAGRRNDSREIYRRLLANAKGTKWEKEAGDRINEINQEIEEAEGIARAIRRAESDRNMDEALARARELCRRFPWTDAAQRCDVKLQIESAPPRAQLLLDGRSMGQTPATIVQRALQPFTLTLRMPGFSDEIRQIDLKQDVDNPYRVEMRRALKWKALTLGPIEAPPLVEDDGAVYVAGRDQRVYSLDKDGNVRWARAIGLFSEFTSKPLRAGNRIVVADRTGAVTALDAGSGTVAWRARVTGQAQTVAAPAGGLAVVADEEGSIVAFDAASGSERWRVTVPGGLAAAPTFDAEGGSIVAPSGENFLLVLDAATGAQKGRVNTGYAIMAPVGISGMGYVVATEGDVLRFLSRDGRQVWQAKTPGAVSTAPLVAGGAVFVGAGNALVALEMQDGHERWPKKEYGAAIRASPAFRANRLYVATGGENGSVHALTAETGSHRWSYRTQGEIVAPPVPQQDTVYVASSDFGVYAIRD